LLAGALSFGVPNRAAADVVDDAYAAGSEAAATSDWEGAVEHWREALELLPGRSAQLEYDLGTAYAQLGDLGRATYHLERALQPEARPSVEVAELARRNLGIVRRQAEIAAESSDARISESEGWWELAVNVLAGQTVAWVSMLAAWLLLITVALRSWQRRRADADPSSEGKRAGDRHGVTGAIALVLSLVVLIGGGLHALAVASERGGPKAIVLDPVVELREGPGTHLPSAFRVQGGSRVRVLEERSGWLRVRLPKGLEGWAKRGSIGRLDRAPKR
jgi:hypothetical protein